MKIGDNIIYKPTHPFDGTCKIRAVIEDHRVDIYGEDVWGVRLENGNFKWAAPEQLTEVS